MPNLLSHSELDALLCVPTTVTEAEQIRERFTCLLDGLEVIRRELENLPKYGGIAAQPKRLSNVDFLKGCPHCENDGGVYQCKGCRYQITGTTSPMACIHFTFAGISYDGLGNHVDIILASNCCHVQGRAVERGDDLHNWFADLHRCQLLCRGHIEWADEVISRGGVK